MVLYNHDSQFTSYFWYILWDLLGTKMLFTSIYYPQIDGQVEYAHFTIEQVVQYLLVELGVGYDN